MTAESSQYYLPYSNLQGFLDALIDDQREIVGPTISQDTIVYRPITRVEQLPWGWTDEQQAARYRMRKDEAAKFFHFNAGPESWKKYLFPPRHELSSATFDADGWHFASPQSEAPRYAFLGARACDLAAIAIQDRVFANGDYVDPTYKRRRDAVLIIAVNCSKAGANCFCTSMECGPKCSSGFDLAMTEIESGFLVEVATAQGRQLVDRMQLPIPTDSQRQQAERVVAKTESSITKRLDTEGIHDLLLDNLEDPAWQEIADRCLSCCNCTMVCPTCFCSSVEEVADLSGENVARVRNWDSCFNLDLSYTASGTVRNSIRSRYRQWLTHKLATWQDQFDVSGCTGCGRCITWCPVGIDLTESVATVREHASRGEAKATDIKE